MRSHTQTSDATWTVTQSGKTVTQPSSYISEQVTRPETIVKGDGVKATPYYTIIERFVHSTVSATSRQTILATWSGPMVSTVHKNTGIGIGHRLHPQAANRAISAVKNQKVNLSMVAAQRKESLTLVKNTTSQIANALSAVARRDWKALAKATGVRSFSKAEIREKENFLRILKSNGKNISAKHLATVFGIMPLIQDVSGIIQEIDADDRPFEFVASGRIKETRELKWKTFHPWRTWAPPGDMLPLFLTTANHHTTETISVRCFLRFRIDFASLHDVSRLGLLNPLYTIWDMVPYSFVVDWVVNVGQWLNSFDYDVGMTYVTGCYSQQKVSRTTTVIDPFTLKATSGTPPVTYDAVNATYTPGYRESKRFDRIVIPSPPQSTLVFKNPLSIFTAAATAALIMQMANTRRALVPRKFSYKPRRSRTLKPIDYKV